jgi:hypothetical protein
MLICPDCHGPLQALGDGASCGWRNERIETVPNLLPTTNRTSPTFNACLANYARIANDDLETSIQLPGTPRAQAKNLFEKNSILAVDMGCCGLPTEYLADGG